MNRRPLPHGHSRRAFLLGSLLLQLVCRSQPRAQREAEFLRQAILAQDAKWLQRAPQRVATKYQRMSRDTFTFFRGSSARLSREPSAFSTVTALVGDPHLENVGTYLTVTGERVVDFNDFDLAGYGPFIQDLRCLAVSVWIVADRIDLGRRQRENVIAELSRGYVQQIRALASGGRPIALRIDTAFGGDLQDILVRRGGADDSAPESRSFEIGVPLSVDEDALVRGLLRRYPQTIVNPSELSAANLAPKQMVSLGLGIGSHPARRFRVVLEGPTVESSDDWVIEFKESQQLPAEQIIAIQRAFQERPDNDRFLGWSQQDGIEFRVRQVTPEQRRLSVERIIKQVKSPRWAKKDFRTFAYELGQLLARGHSRTPGKSGANALPDLALSVGNGRALVAELVDYTTREASRIEDDLRLFRELLRTHGPLLGHAETKSSH